MKSYNQYITLTKNFRGVYTIDTSKGCCNGLKDNKRGCYSECYAAKYAKIYGYNFTETITREFKDIKHLDFIRNQLYNIDMPFFRIGVFGDPSDNWEHTLSTINLLSGIKPIVLITKHWNLLTLSQLNKLSKYDLCINTSISALDKTKTLIERLNQYNIIKNYCKSVLRIVSCSFNVNHLTGLYYDEIQKKLFDESNTIDNVLRVRKNNHLVKMRVINITKENFLNGTVYFSKLNKDTHTGYCFNCPDLCGLTTKN